MPIEFKIVALYAICFFFCMASAISCEIDSNAYKVFNFLVKFWGCCFCAALAYLVISL